MIVTVSKILIFIFIYHININIELSIWKYLYTSIYICISNIYIDNNFGFFILAVWVRFITFWIPISFKTPYKTCLGFLYFGSDNGSGFSVQISDSGFYASPRDYLACLYTWHIIHRFRCELVHFVGLFPGLFSRWPNYFVTRFTLKANNVFFLWNTQIMFDSTLVTFTQNLISYWYCYFRTSIAIFFL